MLDWPGFLINSHDPLRGHVLKHIRQHSLTSLRYSVADEGKMEVRKERTTKYFQPLGKAAIQKYGANKQRERMIPTHAQENKIHG